MRKKIPLSTAEMIRQIEAYTNDPFDLERFTAAFETVRNRHGKEPIFKDLLWGIDRNLLVIECNLGVNQDSKSTKLDRGAKRANSTPDIREVAEAGIMAGMRFMAIMTALDWPLPGPRQDFGLRDLIRQECRAHPHLSQVANVDSAYAKWHNANPQKQPPIKRDYVLKHFKNFFP